MLTQDLWIALVFIDVACTLWFFLDIKSYWSNLASAAMCYFISTGLSSAMVAGVDAAGTTITDPWLANIFAWHSYLMIALAAFCLLRNTVLSNDRRGAKETKKGGGMTTFEYQMRHR